MFARLLYSDYSSVDSAIKWVRLQNIFSMNNVDWVP